MDYKASEQAELNQGWALSTIALKRLLELICLCWFLVIGEYELRFKYVITDALAFWSRLWDHPDLQNQGICQIWPLECKKKKKVLHYILKYDSKCKF